VSADETKNTPDVEATEPAQPDDAATPPEAEAKKPARKPAAKKTAKAADADKAKAVAEDAAPKAEKAEKAETPAGDEAKPAKKPARKAAAKTTDETPAEAPAPEAAEAPAEKAEAPAEKKPARKAAAKKSATKPAKPAAKAPAELRHGKPGVATVVGADGKDVETRELNQAVFGVAADVNALHLVVRAEQAARRRGTASTKTRGEISGSTAKLFRQKGTGRARAGSVKSPVRTGGGTAFGPKPRSYEIKVNRKVVRKALAMALSNRAENGNLYVAAGLQVDAPSTARVNEFLVNLDIAAPVLVVTADEPAVAKSVRNLFYAETAEVGALSTEQVLRARSLVLTEKAFDALNQA
jgi:large subunit ribosomal protein L4